MDRGRRPVETVPDHGINIGADVTKAWLIDKENFNFFEFSFLWFLELFGLEI